MMNRLFILGVVYIAYPSNFRILSAACNIEDSTTSSLPKPRRHEQVD